MHNVINMKSKIKASANSQICINVVKYSTSIENNVGMLYKIWKNSLPLEGILRGNWEPIDC